MILGYNPAFTQLAIELGLHHKPHYTANAVFCHLLGYAKQYDDNIGMGTLISLLIPYSLVMGIFWIILFIIWFLLGLPVGPGAPIFL